MVRKVMMLGIAVLLCAPVSQARQHREYFKTVPLTPREQQLVQEAIVREKATTQEVEKTTPVVQTYIQDMRPDPKLYQVPVGDQYMMGRVDFSRTFRAGEYAVRDYGTEKRHFFSGSLHFMSGLTRAFHVDFMPTGFMAMMFVDPSGFNQQNYNFRFVRREFLGNVRTWVFDVEPKRYETGRFLGRIWIEDQDGNIVRFNGTYLNNPNNPVHHYFHFDSWRMNIQPGLWVPAAVYVEDTERELPDGAQSFRGQTTFWGYSLKLPTDESTAESMEIENAEDESANNGDMSPLQAEREWVTQAAQNVLDRLTQAGLLAPPSNFDKVLETVTNNLIISNNLQLPGEIHCRVLLTEPLESLSVGNTILISKGLVDVLPNEPSLAAVISFQLAHILLGNHIDTRYAFNDRLLFPDSATFQQIEMNHSALDDEAAAKKAIELFDHSNYKGQAGQAGLFFEQVEASDKQLAALFTPRLGDSLLAPNGQPWLAALTQGAPKLNVNNLTQTAALPLNSRLKIDPWNDKVYMLHFTPAPILNPEDKMPLEIAPVYLKLQRYQEQSPAAAPVGTAPPANASGSQ